MLSNYPKVLKYAIGDRPWMLSDQYYIKTDSWSTLPNNGWSGGNLRRVKITGWRTKVTTSNNDGATAVQENFYTVKEITGYGNWVIGDADYIELYDIQEFEISETKLFSSRNHALSVIKGKYLNSVFEGLTENGSTIFKNMGRIGDAGGLSNGDWTDWAGWDFRNVNFKIQGEDLEINYIWGGDTGLQSVYVGGELGGDKTLIVDNCNFQGATLPFNLNTKAKMRTNCFSYDEITTIWTDGTALGRV